MDGRKDGYLTGGWIPHRWMEGWMDGWLTDGRAGWMDRRKDGWLMGGWRDGWNEGWMTDG